MVSELSKIVLWRHRITSHVILDLSTHISTISHVWILLVLVLNRYELSTKSIMGLLSLEHTFEHGLCIKFDRVRFEEIGEELDFFVI